MGLRFEVLTWGQVYRMVLELGKKIVVSSFKPEVIIAVLRGGYLPARVLSDFLGGLEIGVIGVKLYVDVGDKGKRPLLSQRISTTVMEKNVLVVDDVADSGESLRLAVKNAEEGGAVAVKTATLHKKPWSNFNPDYYLEETAAWVVYPWEWYEFSKSMVKKLGAEGKSKSQIIEFLTKIGIDRDVVGQTLG